jgi:pyruvate dehydrogenase E1 component beta subunit
MGFVFPAFNQIVAHAARIRNRTRGRYQAPLVLRIPYGGGLKAPEHHSESTEALFCQFPGLKVVVPSTPYDAKGLLISSIRDDDPVLFLEPIKLYQAGQQEFPDETFEIPLGEAKTVREGDNLTIITWGAMVPVVESAAEKAEKEEIFAEVIDLRTLSPLDHQAILDSVKNTGRALIVHEAPKTCGLGAEIAARLSEENIFYLEAPILRVTGYDITTPLPKGEDLNYPSQERILEAIFKIMEY